MSPEADNITNCERRVAARAKAAEAGERMRIWINVIPVVGAPLAAFLAWVHPLLGSVAVASLTLGWIVGIYRTELFCQLTSGRLQDAEQTLSQARAYAEGPGLTDHAAGTPGGWSSAASRARRDKAAHPPVYRH